MFLYYTYVDFTFHEVLKTRRLAYVMVAFYPHFVSASCTRCGNCVEICPSYMATGEIKNSPMGRLELIRRGAAPEELFTSFSKCTMCKRCAYRCPLGLDVAEVTRIVRESLARIGYAQPYVQKVVGNFLKTGNNIGMTPKVVEMAIRVAVRRAEKEKGDAPRVFLHMDGAYREAVSGAEEAPRRKYALLFPSSSDIFEFDAALRGYIYVLHRLGFDVVISLKVPDTANYGYYLSTESMYKIAEMYLAEIRKVSPALVVFGECGHGWHVFVSIVAPKTSTPSFHIHQLTYRAYTRGVLRLEKVDVERPVVYMDPCNYSRGALPIVKEPRALLKAIVGDFAEVWIEPRDSICCLGGGGLIAPEMLNTAVKYWQKLRKRLSLGAKTVVRPCATCKAQLKRVFNAMGLDANVTGVIELVYKAVR
ncbi:(Fe-S)-binding protein [Pyrobaculum sp.]|uniref:4Fe-4S ferredoxin, iron-sulfur binding domain protein n=3 Tax=Pyrobaculum TaxID=2276 RepID=A4WMS4_PYRAR|nr:4Fe-4S ferredoxin, iron-sulfur binding domain protein [Pyrobaculum arsenaticum DSM 13514]